MFFFLLLFLFTQLISAYLSFGSQLKHHFCQVPSLTCSPLLVSSMTSIFFPLYSSPRVSLAISFCVHLFVSVLPPDYKLSEGINNICFNEFIKLLMGCQMMLFLQLFFFFFSRGCPGVTSKSTRLGVQENQDQVPSSNPNLLAELTKTQHLSEPSFPSRKMWPLDDIYLPVKQ